MYFIYVLFTGIEHMLDTYFTGMEHVFGSCFIVVRHALDNALLSWNMYMTLVL